MQHLGGDYVGYTRMQVQGMFAQEFSTHGATPDRSTLSTQKRFLGSGGQVRGCRRQEER